MSPSHLRVLLLVLLFVGMAASGMATDQVRFAPPSRYPAGSQPKSIALLDLNGDGKLDIVAGSPTDQKLYVLLGNGDGTFQPAVAYATANASPMAVVLGDFNGDGRPDIAVVTGAAGGTYPAYMVLPGNGDGSFGAPIITPSNISPLFATGVDVNADGNLDLVVSGNGSSAVAYGNGDGTFQRPEFIPPASPIHDSQWALAAADLNNDGHTDLFTGSSAGYVSVYLANADGTFQTPVNMRVQDPGEQGVTAVAAADLNGDGFVDIIALGSNSNGVEVLINKGDGTFQTPVGYYGGTTPVRAVLADFNGDGNVDVAFADYNNSTWSFPADNFGVSAIPGASGGALNFSTGFSQFDADNHAADIAVGDLNGDGLPDVVTADTQDNAVSVLLNGAAVRVTASSSADPALPGQSVTLSAAVQPLATGGPAPTGTVTFLSNANVIGTGTLDASSIASISTTFALPVSGSFVTISALYSGDNHYVGSSDTALGQRVGYPTTTTLSANPAGPLPVGGTTTLTANVSSPYGAPTGKIGFYDSGTKITSTPLIAGTASLLTAALGDGQHDFKASYERDSAAAQVGLLSSTAHATVAVGSATVTVLTAPASAKPGDPVTLTATVDTSGAAATGTISFAEGSATLGTATLNNGSAQITLTSLSIGPHVITAVYSGDAGFTGSTSASETVHITAPTTVTVSAPAAANTAVPVTISASVSAAAGTPTGTLQFFDGTTLLGSASLLNGTASLATSILTAGTHSISAAYGGDVAYQASASASVSLVMQYPTTVSLTAPATANAGSSVAITAVVGGPSGTPTGSVTFKEGSTQLGTITLTNGSATFTVQNISAGSHAYAATYSGDAAFTAAASTSSAGVTVSQDFSLSLPSPAPVTVSVGKAAIFTISVAPQPGGFTSQVQFTCSGLPAQAACSFSPSTVTPGTAVATTTLTISTAAASARAAALLGFVFFTLLPLGVVTVGGSGIRRRYLLALLVLVALLAGMPACGGGSNSSPAPNPPTPAGTYTVTVIAQSGQTTHTATVTMTVQ